MRSILLALLVASSGFLHGQDRFAQLTNQLEAAVVDHPGLDGTVELSVSGTPVTEFVRALGVTHKLNITVDPTIKGEVVYNFSNARVIDVLVFLCKRHSLDVEFMGSIIILKIYEPPVVVSTEPVLPRQIGVTWIADSAWLDLDLQRDTLGAVARAIGEKSGVNVILAPGLDQKLVSVYVRKSPIAGALEKLAFANGLLSERTKDGAYLIRSEATDPSRNNDRTARPGNTGSSQMIMEVVDGQWLSVHAKNDGMNDVIEKASELLGKNYFLYDVLDKPVTLHLERVTYHELLTHMLKGTDFMHVLSEGIHLIGKRDLEGMRRTELVRLHNRPLNEVMKSIPEGIKKGVTISEFVELNGLVMSGDPQRIEEIKAFVRSVDQVVPVVMIEVMIVDVNRSRTVTTGLKAGIGGGPQTSGGTVLPGVDYNLNSGAINSLINSFNGFGIFNLGNVTPDFYLSIQALETDGMLKLRSTPQLSTLNGHEATLSIGQTEFYLEIRNDLIGTQNPTVTTSQIYKPIRADLSLTIRPVVSSENMVTLEIEVNQSTFTTRIAETAPPGSVERKFSSIVRARDKDMIILGGLEEKEASRSGSGVPLLSRIPVLKWFFGSRTKKNRRSKLTIFIRPTIIY